MISICKASDLNVRLRLKYAVIDTKVGEQVHYFTLFCGGHKSFGAVAQDAFR